MDQEHDPRQDELIDEWRDSQMGVKARKVRRHGLSDDVELITVHRKRTIRHGNLETGEPTETVRWEKVAEFEPQVATEVLMALSEAHGYDLSHKGI